MINKELSADISRHITNVVGGWTEAHREFNEETVIEGVAMACARVLSASNNTQRETFYSSVRWHIERIRREDIDAANARVLRGS